MISRSFQVLAPVRTPFLLMDEWFIMCRHLFIHSFSNRHLDWSRFLAIVKVIYRDSRQVFVWIHIFYSLGYTLSSRVPGSDSNSVIKLWESCLIDTLATLLSSMGTGGWTASGSPHWNLFSFCLVVGSWQVLARMWRKWKASTPSVTNIGIATMKHWMEVPPKAKNRTINWIKPPTS